MAKYIDINRQTEVIKADSIVKARYKLNPLSLKFITTVIAGLKRGDDLNEIYGFKVKEFKELLGLKRKDLYWAVKEAAKELLEKPLYIPKGDEYDDSFLMFNWVASAEYKEGEGIIEFEISKKLRPYLLDVKERFLKYRLENILSLTNNYTIRFYEILKDWLEINKRYGKKAEKVISLLELREMLEISHGYTYHDIKRRILEKAKKEFVEKTDIKFEYEEIKTGRKVSHLRFIIVDNNPDGGNRLQQDDKKNIEHKKITVEDVVVRIPDSVKAELKQVSDELMNEVSRYISEKGIDYVMSNIRYANNNAKDNYIAYLLQALKNDWAKNIREGQDEQNKYEQASKEYKKFVGKTVLIKGVEHTIEESSIYNTKENCAIPIGDILKNWDKWHPFLEKAAVAVTTANNNTQQNKYTDKRQEIQEILSKMVSE